MNVDGESVDGFETEFPPDHTPGPSFYAGGLANGPYTFTIETDADRASVEWSIHECSRLTLVVTVLFVC